MNRIKQYIQLIFHGHYDTSTPEGRSLERSRNIALTAMSAMLAKVIAMIVPLVTVRLTLSYMGEEIFVVHCYNVFYIVYLCRPRPRKRTSD